MRESKGGRGGRREGRAERACFKTMLSQELSGATGEPSWSLPRSLATQMLSLGTLLRGPITFQLSTLETVLQYVNAGRQPSPATAGLFLFGWAGAEP